MFRNISRNRLYQFDDLSGSDTTSAKGREANYGAASVGVVAIEQDGSLGACTDLATLPGEPGPNCKEQASSHPHECPFDRAGRCILVPDKGLDRAFNFLFDGAHGKLMPNDPPFVATREGAGARHIAFHPSLPFAYVIDELDWTMTTYPYDSDHGRPQPVQVVPTTPPIFTSNSTGAEVAVAPSGRFVYGSNRGCNPLRTLSLAPFTR